MICRGRLRCSQAELAVLSPTFLADVDATVMAEQDPEPGVDFNGSMASDKVGLCRLALEAREAPAKRRFRSAELATDLVAVVSKSVTDSAGR
eukprot:3590355-Rhodomonas_salina.3